MGRGPGRPPPRSAPAQEDNILNFQYVNEPHVYDRTIQVEEVFYKAYSNAKFEEVKEEVIGLKYTNIFQMGGDETMTFYNADEKVPYPIWKSKWKHYTLSISKIKGDYSCSCKLFEFKGILCKHIIRVMEVEEVEAILEKYMLGHWRKDVVRSYKDIYVSYYNLDDSSIRAQKMREISKRHKYLLSLAMHSEMTFLMYKEATDSVHCTLEVVIVIDSNTTNEQVWWDPSVQKVYGRRIKLHPKNCNLRHLDRLKLTSLRFMGRWCEECCVGDCGSIIQLQ